MGSVFRLPCITGELPGIISGLKEMGFRVYGSMLDSSAAKLGELEFPERAAVVIGSEGAGISGATAKACDQAVYIPISGAESLNAGARRGDTPLGAVKALNDIFKLDMTCPAYPHMSAV